MAEAGATPWGARTLRKDPWWVQPSVTVLVLSAFLVYATYRVFENDWFIADNGNYHYATPFGNPDLSYLVPAVLGSVPLVGQFFFYPAAILLPVPAGFRFTCYYYRKAYYRGFAAMPPACSVKGMTGRSYQGERRLLLVQNLHRYFLYLALVVLVFNLLDAVRSVWTPHGAYFGLGSVIMLLNVVLLGGYTLGCHSLRHLVGGKLDCFTCTPLAKARYSLWSRVTMLNQRHMLWAWSSLVWVGFTDGYIRWVARTGVTTVFGVPA